MLRLEFRLTGQFIALNDLLKVTGVCGSGGAGKVRVDGAVESRKTCKIRAGQAVRVGGVEIHVLGDDPAP